MESNANVDGRDYLPLKDLCLEINSEDGSAFSFWLYLTTISSSFPSDLLLQIHPFMAANVPFLALSQSNDILISPLLFFHHEAPSTGTSISKIEIPLKEWVHIECEVSIDFVRLHIDGDIAGEKRLTPLLSKNPQSVSNRRVSLTGPKGDGAAEGYVHNVKVFPLDSRLETDFSVEPPVQLSVDSSSVTDIKEDNDGVWNIVCGEASCSNNFSMDVVLLDAFGQLVDKDLEVVASLAYADSEEPVEIPNDEEYLLLSSYGVDFASGDRPSKLVNGRASFKLKIYQLSSKCDIRLFRIKFCINKMERYPFFEVFSHPIRCISQNRNVQPSTLIWRRSTSDTRVINGIQPFDLNEASAELFDTSVHEAKSSPSLKRFKIGEENPFSMSKYYSSMNQPSYTTNEDTRIYEMSLEVRPENHKEIDSSSTESDSSEATNSLSMSISSNGSLISDSNVFKYCLGGLTERALLLKDNVLSASVEELVNFAEQVSLYSGCAHHRNQITMSRRLIEEGTNAWISISSNKQHVLWENLVVKLNDHFMKISCSNSRFLLHQDFEVLRRIGGCQEVVDQENFEKIWCWLYPVACALSQDWINPLWNSVCSPKWIEGLITKEEAESSLQGPSGLQDPGTFVLRFPTSRSWPHPDAGNLIVSYVGTDHAIHHKLLSLDLMYSSGPYEMTVKPLKDMLLEEPELSGLGRVIRGYKIP